MDNVSDVRFIALPLPLMCDSKRILRIVCWLSFLIAIGHAADESRPAEARYDTRGKASRDGIGKIYFGREIAQVMGHQAAGWLERPEREAEERTYLLFETLALKPGEVVADIGAGSGYFSWRMAQRVGGKGVGYG